MGSGASMQMSSSLDETSQGFTLAACKDRGNTSFKGGMYNEAIFWYSKCLAPDVNSSGTAADAPRADEDFDAGNDISAQTLIQKESNHNVSIVYSNRSASFLCNLQPNAALNDAKQAIWFDPNWGKPFFRAAAAAFQLGMLLDAKEYVAKALFYFPADKKLVDLEQAILKSFEDDPAPLSATATTSTSSNGSSVLRKNDSGGSRGDNKRNVVSGVMCWGAGLSGELGLGASVQNSESPQHVHKFCNSSIIDISCGLAHSVCVDSNGNVYSWGNNKHGQLGIGSHPSASSDSNSTGINQLQNPLASSIAGASYISNEYRPVVLRSLLDKKFVGVSCGAGHCIVVSEDGEVLSWGIGRQGQLGLGQECVASSLPRLISLPAAVTSAIDTAGAASSNSSILSANSSSSSSSRISPLKNSILPPPRVRAVSCGIAHTFILTDNGDLLAFGMNAFGQLGFDRQKYPCVFTPQAVFINSRQRFPITHVSCGGAHTLVIDSNGRLFSTGSNSCGQLGVVTSNLSLDANPFDPNRDRESNYVDNLSDQFIRVTGLNASPCAFCACGEEFSAVITQSRSVYLWGLGIAGQMGDGSLEDRAFPTKVMELEGKGVNSLSCSQTQVIAVTLTGTIFTWGLPGSQAKKMQQQQQLLGGDEKAYKDSLDLFVIKKPIELNVATKLNRSIKQITCGRMHYGALVRVAHGAHSYLKTGLVVYPSSLNVEAGKEFSFIVQTADEDGNFTVGGDQVKVEVTCDNVAYEKQLLKLNLLNYKGFEVVDSFDGQYTVLGHLPLSGEYYIDVIVNGIAIKDSPFRVCINPTTISPPKCFCWFGIYAKSSTAVNRSLTSGYGTELAANDMEEIMFTVSLRDVYGNYPPIVSSAGATIIVTIEETVDDGSGKCFVASSNTIDIPDRLDISVIPCTVKTPKIGEYVMKVAICVRGGEGGVGGSSGSSSFDSNLPYRIPGNNNNNVADPMFTVPVMGSPFKLTVYSKPFPVIPTARVDSEAKSETIGGIDAEGKGSKEEYYACSDELLTVPGQDDDEAINARVLEVSKAESTRRRAELALRQHQLNILKQKEDKKKSMAKRIGGGFMIQYSKDI